MNVKEIQSRDLAEIAREKAVATFRSLRKPVVVTDTSWNIPALGGFPGGYMKDVAAWFTPDDYWNLVKDKGDKRISFIESVVYQDERRQQMFSKEYWAMIVNPPRGIGVSIERVAEFDGFTLGEYRQQANFSHKPEDYVWWEFASWFSDLR